MSVFFVATSIFVVLPVIAVIMSYIIVKKFSNGKKPFMMAIDLSTIFFILSVFVHVNVLFPMVSFYYLIYLLIGIGLLVTYLHWKKNQDLLFLKLLKQYWRMTFFVFFLFYITMVCYGLFQRIMEYLA
ncbi:MAG: DUF3397 domain-containing protein [Bacillaceae bacterium]